MKKQDWPEFSLLMGELALAFRTDISTESIKVYGKHLADYPIESVKHAVKKSIENGEKFPVIKTLREFANSYRPSLGKPVVTQAIQIEEFTREEIESSRQKLADIINGIGDCSGPVVRSGDFLSTTDTIIRGAGKNGGE